MRTKLLNIEILEKMCYKWAGDCPLFYGEQNLENKFKNSAAELGIELKADQIAKFIKYKDSLVEGSKTANLTAIKEDEEIMKLHFLDSIAVLRYFDFKSKSICDIGSGAGFPGAALKIAEESLSVSLLECRQKRVNFLEKLISELELNDCKVLPIRAEEAGEELRESFDIVISRAVADLRLLSELSMHLVKKGGVMLAMKGPEPEQELAAAKKGIELLGGRVEAVHEYVLPWADTGRSLIVIRKEKITPKKYPRRFAQMKKSPL